jgi:hypothetical protein
MRPTESIGIKISLLQYVYIMTQRSYPYILIYQNEWRDKILEDVASAFDFTREGFTKEFRTLYFELSLENSAGISIRSNRANKVSLRTITIPARE